VCPFRRYLFDLDGIHAPQSRPRADERDNVTAARPCGCDEDLHMHLINTLSRSAVQPSSAPRPDAAFLVTTPAMARVVMAHKVLVNEKVAPVG